ncbi:hypothetical protein MG293_009549 [Ovis ammon polii]|uniref:Uncharacterized protein n=1 Tax=Ovis ammon polii TaxID=230172 RepID=A0AAD4YAA1_OVIAM|nr:hypothetical protein MG293_009549 [Ovis ammon polii]
MLTTETGLFSCFQCWFRIWLPRVCQVRHYFSKCFPESLQNAVLVIFSIPYPCWIWSFLPPICDFSRNFRTKQRLIIILLYPPFSPSIALFFIGEIKYSEKLINYKT